MKRTIQIVIGLLVGVACVWILFRGTDWHAVSVAIQGVSIFWLLVSFVMLTSSFFTRVQRWSYIVRATKPVSFRHMFSATQIGFFANFILPGRVGELLRAVVLARLERLSISRCFAMVALDRVTDMFGLVAVVIVVIFAYSPQGLVVIPKETFNFEQDVRFSAAWIHRGEMGIILMMVVLIAAFVALYVNQALFLRLFDRCAGLVSKRLAAWGHNVIQQFADGLHIFRSASDMAKCIVWSLITWGTFLLTMFTAMKAFGIHAPWYTMFVMELLVAVSISVPGAPGFVGQFHIPIVVTLMLVVPNMDISTAKAFAIVAHLLNVIPVAIVGVACMFLEQFGLAEIREAKTQVIAETTPTEV